MEENPIEVEDIREEEVSDENAEPITVDDVVLSLTESPIKKKRKRLKNSKFMIDFYEKFVSSAEILLQN